VGGLIFLSLATCSFASSLSKEKVVVFLKAEARIRGDSIYLEEIVQDIKADKPLKQKLMRIKVGSFPFCNRKRILSKDYILVRLYQSGLSPGDVVVEGREKIVVTRESFLSPLEDKLNFSEGEENYLVKKGDMVNLVVEEANLRVVMRGRALESGKKGEMVQVLNISSFKKVKGEIVAPFTVKVNPVKIDREG